MTFEWPGLLWVLLLIPMLAGVYVLWDRRRQRTQRRAETRFQLADVLGRRPGFRRHVPAAVFLLGAALGIAALSRPSAAVLMPGQHGTVILSLDISGSMRARDIRPTRMEAVKDAARAFVRVQRQSVRLGVVAFSGTAFLVQAPTTDKNEVLAAIDRLSPQMFTAIGSGLEVALDALFPNLTEQEGADSQNAPLPDLKDAPPPVAPGSDTDAAIILLSDGQSNQGIDPLEAAEKAANLGVRVYTVGVGTKEGADLSFGTFSFHAVLDEATLKKIALITAGRYYKASNAEELRGIYQSLGSRLEMQREDTEITALVVAAALAMLLVAGALSVYWFNRPL
ncbi:MAG TPA: VWA domain-containing protein [bacterium]|nr:VWA domain-containing protein [bacterium]